MTNSINSKALGLTFGVVSGLAVFMVAIFAMFGFAVPFAELISTVYPGYSASIQGALLGLVYGFLDGFIGGIIIGWLYNKFNK